VASTFSDEAFQARVAGLVNFAHAALTKFGDDFEVSQLHFAATGCIARFYFEHYFSRWSSIPMKIYKQYEQRILV
jgi:hypothetical protein